MYIPRPLKKARTFRNSQIMLVRRRNDEHKTNSSETLRCLVRILLRLIPSMVVVGSDGHGRKPKKEKAKANNDYEAAAGSKWKRGLELVSVTPDIEDDEEDHESTCVTDMFTGPVLYLSKTAKGEDCCNSQQFWSRYTACHM
jgi:hypothetical protein